MPLSIPPASAALRRGHSTVSTCGCNIDAELPIECVSERASERGACTYAYVRVRGCAPAHPLAPAPRPGHFLRAAAAPPGAGAGPERSDPNPKQSSKLTSAKRKKREKGRVLGGNERAMEADRQVLVWS